MKAEFKELDDALNLFGGPASPVYVEIQYNDGSRTTNTYPGMSLREYFAGQALVGQLAYPRDRPMGETFDEYQKRIAENCYSYADAMLAERAKR